MRYICSCHYLPQLKFTDDPDKSCVETPTAPARCTVNEIKLIDPLAVGKTGVPPDGNKKYVLNPTVAIPEFTTRRV